MLQCRIWLQVCSFLCLPRANADKIGHEGSYNANDANDLSVQMVLKMRVVLITILMAVCLMVVVQKLEET